MNIKRITPEEALEIRHAVLWPNKPKEFSRLEDDDEGIHYGYFVDNKLVTTASVFIDNGSARLRKFATLKEYQGRGYGTEVINFIITELRGKKAAGIKPVATLRKKAAGVKPAATLRKKAAGIKPVATLRKKAAGIKPVATLFWCDARLSAKGFYKNFGMEPQGDTFYKSEVEYIVMKMEL